VDPDPFELESYCRIWIDVQDLLIRILDETRYDLFDIEILYLKFIPVLWIRIRIDFGQQNLDK
jgi:hypothetical protein